METTTTESVQQVTSTADPAPIVVPTPIAVVGEVAAEETVDTESLTAAPTLEAAPITDDPPAAFFADPQLSGPTALTVDADTLQIRGHLAAWKTPHIGFPGKQVHAPKSRTDYAYFRTGATKTAEGRMVPTGVITLGTGHADLRTDARTAAAHYDNTGAAVADVNVGEDAHGIWIAGALRPNVSADRIRELRGAALSGDWRPIRGNRELVAALAVNVPGFPIPRTEALAADGRELALVAAGIVRNPEPWEVAVEALTEEVAVLREQVVGLQASALRAQYPAVEAPIIPDSTPTA